MAITIIQKAKRKKIIFIAGVAIIIIALLLISYLTFIKPSGQQVPVDNEKTTTSILSEKIKRLEIKWDALEDQRFENMESFPDVSSLEIEESGRENPFLPY